MKQLPVIPIQDLIANRYLIPPTIETKSGLSRKVDLVGDQLFIDDKFAARIEHSDELDSPDYFYFHFYVNGNTGMYIIGIDRNAVENTEEAQHAAIKRFASNPKIYKYG